MSSLTLPENTKAPRPPATGPSRCPEVAVVRFPNPPLAEIQANQILAARDAAERFHVEEATIRKWVHLGLIEAVIPGTNRDPALYYLPALAEAEYLTWCNGAHRAWRGGRHPDWRPGVKVAA